MDHAHRSKSMSSPPSEGIFERSLSCSMLSLPPSSRQKLARTLSNCSQHSNCSYAIPDHHSTEDYVAPVLDTTTEILTNPHVDLNKVNIVCCCEEEEDGDYPTDQDSDSQMEFAASNMHEHLKLSLTVNQTPHSHHNSNSSSSKPRPRSRSRSRLSISKSLLNSMSPTNPRPPPHFNSHTHNSHLLSGRSSVSLASHNPNCPTINFYSFADMLDNERGAEGMIPPDDQGEEDADDACQLPPQFRGFSFSKPAPAAGQAPLEAASRSNTTLLSSQLSADGFTTISMKDYIAKIA